MDTAKRVAERFKKKSDSDMSLPEAFRFLGVPQSSSMEEVTDAFKKLMLKWHPDRNPGNPAAAEHAKMLGKAYRIIKERKEGMPSSQRGAPPGGWRDEDSVKEEQPEQSFGKPWQEAARDLPTGVEWKFQSDTQYGSPKDELREKYLNAPDGVWCHIVVGQSQSHYVFVLIEHMKGKNYYKNSKVDDWSVSRVLTYPLAQDITKIAPKAIKQLTGEVVLCKSAFKLPKKYYVLDGDRRLTEVMLTKQNGRGIALNDALQGSGMVSSADSERLPMIEIEGVLNNEKRKRYPEFKTNRDSWRWYDFTVYVNGKGYRLNDKSVFNFFAHESTNREARLIGFGVFNYEWGQRKNLTKLKGGTMKLPAIDALRCLEAGLEGESGELVVAILKAMEILDPENKKTKEKRAAIEATLPYDYARG